MYRLEDVIDMSKLSKMDLGKLDLGRLGALLGKKEEEKKKTNPAVWVAVIAGIVAVAAAIGYGVYRYFAPDYLRISRTILTMSLMTNSLRMKKRNRMKS